MLLSLNFLFCFGNKVTVLDKQNVSDKTLECFRRAASDVELYQWYDMESIYILVTVLKSMEKTRE